MSWRLTAIRNSRKEKKEDLKKKIVRKENYAVQKNEKLSQKIFRLKSVSKNGSGLNGSFI